MSLVLLYCFSFYLFGEFFVSVEYLRLQTFPFQDFEYILLFDVIDAPTTASSAVWTTHPFGYDAISVVKSDEQSVVKKIMRNGIMLIEKEGALFDLQGRKYNN